MIRQLHGPGPSLPTPGGDGGSGHDHAAQMPSLPRTLSPPAAAVTATISVAQTTALGSPTLQPPHLSYSLCRSRPSSPSPSLLPSPPPSVPSVSETPNDIDRLADGLDRQHLERMHLHRESYTVASGAALSLFDLNQDTFRPCSGGNEPVTGLEVDTDTDDNFWVVRPPSPDVPSRDTGTAADSISSLPLTVQSIIQSHVVPSDITSSWTQPAPPTTSTTPRTSSIEPPYKDHSTEAGLDALWLRDVMPTQPPIQRHAPVAQSSPYPRLSPESLAMPRHAPLRDDVPSSSYDLQGWLNSFSAEAKPAPAPTTGMPSDEAAGSATSTYPEATTNDNTTADAFPTLTNDAASCAQHSDRCSTWTAATDLLPGRLSSTPLQPRPGDRTSKRPAGSRRRKSKLFYTVYLPQRPLPPAGLANFTQGPNPPIVDLDVDMEEPELSRDGLTSPTAAGIDLAAASNAEPDMSRPGFLSPSASQLALQHRVHRARAQVQRARTVLSIQSDMSADGASTVSSAADADSADAEMMDLATIGLGSDLVPIPNQAWLECLPSLRQASQSDGSGPYTGPLRYRMSADLAMRCTQLVHNKPRMRRRRPRREGPFGFAEDGSVCDSIQDRSKKISAVDKENGTEQSETT